MIQQVKKRAKQSLKGNFGLALLGLLIFSIVTGIINSLASRVIPGFDENYFNQFQGNLSPEQIQSLLSDLGIRIVLFVILSIAVNILLASIIQLGLIRYFNQFSLSKEPSLEMLFFGFKESYTFKLKSLVLVSIYAFVWFLPYTLFVTAGTLLSNSALAAVSIVLGFVAFIFGFIKVLDYALVPYLLSDEKESFESVSELIEKSRTLIQGRKGSYVVLGLSFILWFFFGVMTFFIGFLYVIPYITQSYVEFYYELNPNPVPGIEADDFA
ncbi:MAG: DUF975 family protein [Acholeplasmataceae bacterium]